MEQVIRSVWDYVGVRSLKEQQMKAIILHQDTYICLPTGYGTAIMMEQRDKYVYSGISAEFIGEMQQDLGAGRHYWLLRPPYTHTRTRTTHVYTHTHADRCVPGNWIEPHPHEREGRVTKGFVPLQEFLHLQSDCRRKLYLHWKRSGCTVSANATTRSDRHFHNRCF